MAPAEEPKITLPVHGYALRWAGACLLWAYHMLQLPALVYTGRYGTVYRGRGWGVGPEQPFLYMPMAGWVAVTLYLNTHTVCIWQGDWGPS